MQHSNEPDPAAAAPAPAPPEVPNEAPVAARVWWLLAGAALAGAAALFWTFAAPAGSGWFFLATAVLLAIWLVGGREAAAMLPVPLRLIDRGRPVGKDLSVAVFAGLVLASVFVLGGLGLALFPTLQASAAKVLAQQGSAPVALLLVTTALTGAAEEVFFRGALQPALQRSRLGGSRQHRRQARPAARAVPIVVGALIYGLVTAATGAPLLVFAAVLLGLVVGWQRQVTGALAAPIITHLIWSLAMLLALPPILGS
ncbi:CPBP family glutamic-type intramembrane protease [Nakamurella aerolata]|uniref:CPBP family intramembrane metalloprotease n=1 Tax=Nakamurella aerolata TaxID=1656892 RepID=A0A849A979_9ACTN|nr:CPBP family intramembrane metalloprotease [Nakamurella aerolata]